MAASVVHRRWDIVLWGSTGFTGQLVARYFAEVLRVRVPGLRWALVGRADSVEAASKGGTGYDVYGP